jgi:hypothetical protein
MSFVGSQTGSEFWEFRYLSEAGTELRRAAIVGARILRGHGGPPGGCHPALHPGTGVGGPAIGSAPGKRQAGHRLTGVDGTAGS